MAIGNSLDIKNKLVNIFDIKKAKIKVINTGVDLEKFKPLNKILCRKKIGLLNSKQVVLFIGSITSIKGVVYLVEAIKILIDQYGINVECILLGDRSDKKYLKIIENRISELNLKNNVFFQEPIPHREIAFWINASDVFVLPSLNEGFGLVALESLACMVPTIATRVGGLKEFIINKQTGYPVECKNSKSIAQEIYNILSKRNTNISKISKNGLEIAKKNDINKQTKKVYEIYNNLINS